MRCIVVAAVTRGFRAPAALLVLGLSAAAALAGEPDTSTQPELLTNLFQLRRCAGQEPLVVHPFRIVADVCDVDSVCGVLVLRDASDAEFLRLDLPDHRIEAGTKVCLEGRGCALKPNGFGLAIVPGLVVDNDGLHGMAEQSGTVFLLAGLNSITVQWFNGIGNFGLNLEYEGPGLPRQRIPHSILSRANVDPVTGATNFSAGLDYRCYEGAWEHLPDFAKLRPAKTGVATNFDLDVRTRNEAVGLEFNGFISIPRDGTYTFHVASDDGSRLFVGESSVNFFVLSNSLAQSAVEKVPATALERNSRPWVTLEGTISSVGIRGDGGEMQMRVGNDDIRVEIFAGSDFAPNLSSGAKVRVSGIYEDVVTEDGSRVPGVLRASSWKAIRPVPASETLSEEESIGGAMANRPATSAAPAPTTPAVISTVAEIKARSPDLVNKQLPVSIRGVVTATLPAVRGAVVQDSTKGIFILLQDIQESEPLHHGEFCQIDGVTDPGLFAPLIVARRITHLGAGQFPQPLHATWNQLMSGSLDTQYAEIDGVVTAIHGQQIVMLTESGIVTLDLNEFRPEVLAGCENARVRIRGCILGPFNGQTRRLEPGALRVADAVVRILAPAPRDLFDAPQKGIAEMMLFDPKAAPFRLLKVGGQVIYGRAGKYFLTDGTNGLLVTTRNSDYCAVGDLVDAVGFLELGGPAAELKEAVLRKTGHAPLPAPTKLAPDHLLLAGYADTLVRVDATLLNQWREGPEYVLDLQSGFLEFKARLNTRGLSVSLPSSGSRLELTGVYAPQGNGSGDGTVNSFELLLNSPAGIRVLATPPWWTLKRVLVLAGILAALLCAVLVWNKELQHKVQERGRQLETEIRNRQRVELRHAAEAERSRIARDLHDELGAGLTEVSLLASTGLGEFRGVEKSKDRFRVIAEKARTLVSGLDVIVWAIDPKRNSLQSFADYVGGYAKELLAASNVVCRLKIPIECDAVTLTGAARHSLFLAVKEALNNVIHHASATEVELQISRLSDYLQIVIADNGCGFDWNAIRRGDGLTNLQERLEALHGQCHIESQPGKGTAVKLIVPLPRDPS